MKFDQQIAQQLFEVMKHRRDVRGNRFTDKPIERSDLEQILQAANTAPSVGFSQPWRFVIIQKKQQRQKIYTLFEKANRKAKRKFKKNPLYKKLKLEGIMEADLNIAVLYRKPHKTILGQTSQKRMGEYSVVCAVQNMWLMARSLNIGIGWVSIINPKKLKKLLGVGKEYKLISYLCVGHVEKFLDEPELKMLQWEEKKALSQLFFKPEATITPILDNDDNKWIENLRHKKATFMLALSNTATAKIEGITQAGIPGLLHLTPTLDAEFLCTGEVHSLKNIAKTPKGVPTPALITRAVHLLSSFGRIELLNLGLKVKPNIPNRVYDFGIKPSKRIDKEAKINAKNLFEQGFRFAQSYQCQDDYLILGESVPSGTTTATATALALDYDVQECFSSSFKKVPNTIREKTIAKALSRINTEDDIWQKLGKVSDNMLLFTAGFVLGVGGRFPLILAGGTQMACVLLVANTIAKERNIKMSGANIALCTTRWVTHDTNSDIKMLLKMLEFPIHAYYADFNFAHSNHPALILYDEGEAKEGVGAGGALVYGLLNGLSKKDITRRVEEFLT